MSHSRTTLLIAGAGAMYLMMRRERRRVERLAAAGLESLLNAIDANDPQTGGHVRRVARYALILADAYGVAPRDRAGIERVALFHDIGKIQEALFDITHDKESLSPEERTLIATHPQRGAEVLEPITFFYPDLGEGVLSHHERWDGTGYPRKLSGLEIPLAARIVAIADTFDAITHQRRYNRPRSPKDAAREIAAERGRQFDPAAGGPLRSSRGVAQNSTVVPCTAPRCPAWKTQAADRRRGKLQKWNAGDGVRAGRGLSLARDGRAKSQDAAQVGRGATRRSRWSRRAVRSNRRFECAGSEAGCCSRPSTAAGAWEP